MDIRKIKKLIELLQESDVAEIEITEGEETIRINRAGASGVNYGAPQPFYRRRQWLRRPPRRK